MSGPDPTVPLAFVDDLDAPVLADGDRHHLERVRRLRPGDRLVAGDGAGRFRSVRLGAGGVLDVDGPVEVQPRPDPPIAVGFALTKGDKPELAVQKLTELGCDRILPFTAARSVVRWDPAKAARNVERLRAVAREAAAQCHRAWLPEVCEVVGFAELAVGDGIALADPGGEPPSLAQPTVLVGPEGGWDPDELAAVPARVRLGAHVLRAETAAVVAGAFLAALRGDKSGQIMRSAYS